MTLSILSTRVADTEKVKAASPGKSGLFTLRSPAGYLLFDELHTDLVGASSDNPAMIGDRE